MFTCTNTIDRNCPCTLSTTDFRWTFGARAAELYVEFLHEMNMFKLRQQQTVITFVLFSATTNKDDDNFRQPQCLSCDLGPKCLFVDATFSSDGRYYVLSCKGPGVPYHQLMTTPNEFGKMSSPMDVLAIFLCVLPNFILSYKT